MIFNTILLEATYNLDFVETLSSFLITKYLHKDVKKLEKTNISKFIPKYLNPKNYKILLEDSRIEFLSFSDKGFNKL